ncbi:MULTISPECIES: alpha/beta fold hydrolase [unclassified Microbacterium]|uniref:alpha/beta fold hydrolase n=1 Tax=unclassified Microbacterium TaxID=2609290 RepID=UPI00217DF678|nr:MULTISPECIES: alpha/beta hydrolase family protein [unclassified Microbacterium]
MVPIIDASATFRDRRDSASVLVFIRRLHCLKCYPTKIIYHMIDDMNDDVKPSFVHEHATSGTFVLVHGAWHGGWCYRRVRRVLQEKGHDVYTPTLTGLGERSHLLDAGINLTTHATDIANVLVWEDLHDVILVAHSYGSWVASAALEEVSDRVAAVVFIDCYLPRDGERLLDHGRPEAARDVEQALAQNRPGRPAPSALDFHVVDSADREWVDSRTTPQPVGSSLEPIRLTGARERVARKVYVRAPAYRSERFDLTWQALSATPGWEMHRFPGGHDVMIDEPELLSRLLLSLVGSDPA